VVAGSWGFLISKERGEDMYIKRICCYCQKYLGSKKVDKMPNPKFNITHGICPECKTKVMMELEEMPPQNQESISI